MTNNVFPRQLFGDPHVMTYDGLSYTLPGSSCDYLLAMDADTYSWFIYGRMRHCGLAAPGSLCFTWKWNCLLI